MLNKKTIALLLTSSGCLIDSSNGRSLIGLQQQVQSMDSVDDAMKMLGIDKEMELQLTLENNMKIKQEEAQKKKLAIKKLEKQKQDEKNQDKFHKLGLIGTDNIAAASTEDMFAFSQVLASGGSVNKAVSQLEQEAKQEKQLQEEKQKEIEAETLRALKEANKSEEEKDLEKKKAQLHNLAMSELENIQANENTAALASLVDAQKLEIMAEQMQGSGVNVEEERKKKAEAEKKKQKEEMKKKLKRKQSLAQQKKDAKRKALERKMKIEADFQKLQLEHGGLNGTEDTGYDDGAMDAYVTRDANVMIQDDYEVEEYETLLLEHRNHLLHEKMNEGKQYIEFM